RTCAIPVRGLRAPPNKGRPLVQCKRSPPRLRAVPPPEPTSQRRMPRMQTEIGSCESFSEAQDVRRDRHGNSFAVPYDFQLSRLACFGVQLEVKLHCI